MFRTATPCFYNHNGVHDVAENFGRYTPAVNQFGNRKVRLTGVQLSGVDVKGVIQRRNTMNVDVLHAQTTSHEAAGTAFI